MGAARLVLIAPAALERHGDLVQAATADAVEVQSVDAEQLAHLSDTVHPQGVIAVCNFCDQPTDAVITADARLLMCCADVRDPGNAGTLIRSADAFGAQGVLLSEGSVDPYNPKAVRASVGSLFHLPVVVGADLRVVSAAARAHGIQVLAADGNGEADLTDLGLDGTLARPTLWLFGNEAWGLPPVVTALADRSVRVPIHGRAESLNIASAAAVCLYATATAQRGQGKHSLPPVAPS